MNDFIEMLKEFFLSAKPIEIIDILAGAFKEFGTDFVELIREFIAI